MPSGDLPQCLKPSEASGVGEHETLGGALAIDVLARRGALPALVPLAHGLAPGERLHRGGVDRHVHSQVGEQRPEQVDDAIELALKHRRRLGFLELLEHPSESAPRGDFRSEAAGAPQRGVLRELAYQPALCFVAFDSSRQKSPDHRPSGERPSSPSARPALSGRYLLNNVINIHKGEHGTQIGAVRGFLRGVSLSCMLITDHQNHSCQKGFCWLSGGRQGGNPGGLHFFFAAVISLPNASVVGAEKLYSFRVSEA